MDPLIQPVYFFDVHGLVGYPDFYQKLIEPLEKRGQSIRFWSRGYRHEAIATLVDNRMEKYVENLIIAEQISDLPGELKTALRKYALGKKWGLKKYMKNTRDGLGKSLKRMGVPNDPEHINLMMKLGYKWLNLSKRSGYLLKFPPLFTAIKQPGVLIETDNVHREWGYIGTNGETPLNFEGYDYTNNCELALVGKYSLLYTPEYPGIWEGQAANITPKEILNRLAEIVLGWQGEQIVMDLGERTGLYQEGSWRHPERGY